MALHVNQLVECINAEPGFYDGKPVPFKVGGKYRIVAIDFDGEVQINVAWKFYSRIRFRPLVERKTDISIFTEMLNPSLEDVANLILQEVTLCP